jgi:hypothetical protein
MFFLGISLNLVLYLASGFSFFKGNPKMALIYGGLGVLLTGLIYFYYRRKSTKVNLKKKEQSKRSDKRDWFSDCGGIVDCIDCHPKSGLDCGHMDCNGPDCGGVDCH